MSEESQGDLPDASALVFALCHEIGNCVGAVRLHAHMLDDTMAPREIALASVELDDLAARASALLALIRPILSPASAERISTEALQVLSSVGTVLEEHGGRGTALRVGIADELKASPQRVEMDRDVLQQLLTSFALLAMEAGEGTGRVELWAEASDGGVSFVVRDDAPVLEDPALWREQMMRGRPLLCAIADALLTKFGGHIEVTREQDTTSIRLVVPCR